KNYLSKDELDSLGRIVNAFLDLAENRAKRNIPMSMEDWAKRLDAFLEFDDREILHDAGQITKKIADEKALSEFEKYRVVQDRLFRSDFDKLLLEVENK
ncbi:MAG: virulence RhuM family protein, partial [Campylobacteraceae bacterium]|nr:virulence RhuM family protein [Campylobacteraceae bacterium]